MQEHRYYHSEEDINYCDYRNAWRNSANAVIRNKSSQRTVCDFNEENRLVDLVLNLKCIIPSNLKSFLNICNLNEDRFQDFSAILFQKYWVRFERLISISVRNSISFARVSLR